MADRHALFISFTKTSSKTDGPCISRIVILTVARLNIMVVLTVGLHLDPSTTTRRALPLHCMMSALLQSAVALYVSPAGRLNQVSWLLLAPASWLVTRPFLLLHCLWHHSLRFDLHASLIWGHSNKIQYIDRSLHATVLLEVLIAANRPRSHLFSTHGISVMYRRRLCRLYFGSHLWLMPVLILLTNHIIIFVLDCLLHISCRLSTAIGSECDWSIDRLHVKDRCAVLNHIGVYQHRRRP